MISINEKILLTGASGFIGANILKTLYQKGYQNINIITRKESNLWRIQDIIDKKQITLHQTDLLDQEAVDEIVKKIKPDYIFHLAVGGAKIGRHGISDNDLIFNNIIGTKNLIDSCCKEGFKGFINTGSSSEYGEKHKSMNETDTLEPNNLYGITKATISMYCNMIAKKHNLPIYNYRIFSAYGQYEDKDKLISYLCYCYAKNIIPILKSPNSVRDFIHIDDISYYYINIDNIKNMYGESFNIGTGKQYKISDVINILKDISGSDIIPKYDVSKTHQYEPSIWKANINKVYKTFFHKNMILKEGLKQTFNWYKLNLSFYE